MKSSSTSPKTRWHRLLGKLLEELLTPVGISVYTEFPVMSDPPKTDILLLRRSQTTWTDEQRLLLPDGLRDSQAGHLLIEFKYTESISDEAFLQALSYDTLYRHIQHLTPQQVQTVLVSAKTPQPSRLVEWGYHSTSWKGVYRSETRFLDKLLLLSLNDLSDEAHNAFLKCFASRREEKQKAFALLRQSGLHFLNTHLEWFLTGLWKYWFSDIGEELMKTELTPEAVMEIGKFWGESYLARLTVEQRLAGLNPKDVLKHLGTQDVLKHLGTQDVLKHLGTQDVLKHLGTQNVLKHLGTQDVLKHLGLQEILSQADPEELDSCLNQLKRKKKTAK